MKRPTRFFLLAALALAANSAVPSVSQSDDERGAPGLPSFVSLRATYPDGRMTLGYRQLHSIKKHFERVNTLRSKWGLSAEQILALEAAGKFFGSLDLSDMRKSVVVVQIDLIRAELLTKNAEDQLAGMDKVGGISSSSVQEGARLIDALVRRTLSAERALADADGLLNKFSVLRDAVVDPLVLSSSMEIATNAFLEASANASAEIEEMRQTDPQKYMEVSRWISTARAAGEVVEKSTKGEKELDRIGLRNLAFPYEPTVWADTQIRMAADSFKRGNPTTSLTTLLDRLNENPDFFAGKWQGEIRGLDLSSTPIGDASIIKYESAKNLKALMFRQYKPVAPHVEFKYLNLYGLPAAIRTTEIPVVGGGWKPYPKTIDMSSSGFSRAMRLYPLYDVIRANDLSSTVALDTLFVQLTTQSLPR